MRSLSSQDKHPLISTHQTMSNLLSFNDSSFAQYGYIQSASARKRRFRSGMDMIRQPKKKKSCKEQESTSSPSTSTSNINNNPNTNTNNKTVSHPPVILQESQSVTVVVVSLRVCLVHSNLLVCVSLSYVRPSVHSMTPSSLVPHTVSGLSEHYGVKIHPGERNRRENRSLFLSSLYLSLSFQRRNSSSGKAGQMYGMAWREREKRAGWSE